MDKYIQCVYMCAYTCHILMHVAKCTLINLLYYNSPEKVDESIDREKNTHEFYKEEKLKAMSRVYQVSDVGINPQPHLLRGYKFQHVLQLICNAVYMYI